MLVLFVSGCILFEDGNIPLSCDELECDIKDIILRIEPESPTVSDTVSCHVEPAIPEGDILSYRWTRTDGTPLGQGQSLDLSPSIVQKGDTVYCSVALGSSDYVSQLYEDQVQIVNALPEISALGISPAVPVLAYDGLYCVPTVSDIDGDDLTVSHTWRLNGDIFSNVQSDGSIAAADIHAGDRWQCTVNVADGEGNIQHTSEDYIVVEGLVWERIPAQTIQIGSPDSERGRDLDETLRTVTLSHDYLIMTTELTESMYGALTGLTLESDCWDCPIAGMSWSEAAELANLLSERDGLPTCYTCASPNGDLECELDMNPYLCRGVRLPTEAEWEIAARAGSNYAFHIGNLNNEDSECFEAEFNYQQALEDIAWYCHNASETQEVAQLNTNSYGLYDMHGNLWEWTNDSYKVWGNADDIDPFSYENNTRVIKGGSFGDSPVELRAASRRSILSATRESYIGVRFVRMTDD